MDRFADNRNYIKKMAIILILGLYFFMSLNLVFSLTLSDKRYQKTKLAEAYVQAYQEQDLEKLATLFYRKGSNEYKNFIDKNQNIFEKRKNDALERAEYVEIRSIWYNPRESCDFLEIDYINYLGQSRHKGVKIYFRQRLGRVYVSRLVEGFIDERIYSDVHQEQDLLRIENKNINQYSVKETDYIDSQTFRGLDELIIVNFPSSQTTIKD